MKGRSFAENIKIGSNNFDQVYEQVLPLLQKKGEIKTADGWFTCQNKGIKYSTFAYHFKNIMQLMVDFGRAENIRNGLWLISKPEK